MENREWMCKYEEMLEDIDKTFQETVKFAGQYMPKKLYAYRKVDNYWRENIFDGCVHLSMASDFNDPFDSLPMIDLINRNSEVGRAYTYFCKSHDSKYKSAKKDIDKVISELVCGTQHDIKISCFTENYDSMS